MHTSVHTSHDAHICSHLTCTHLFTPRTMHTSAPPTSKQHAHICSHLTRCYSSMCSHLGAAEQHAFLNTHICSHLDTAQYQDMPDGTLHIATARMLAGTLPAWLGPRIGQTRPGPCNVLRSQRARCAGGESRADDSPREAATWPGQLSPKLLGTSREVCRTNRKLPPCHGAARGAESRAANAQFPRRNVFSCKGSRRAGNQRNCLSADRGFRILWVLG